jgi:hypothetical protein
MPKLSSAECGWIAYENEREASRWALQSMAKHVEAIERELTEERDRAAQLEADLHAARAAEPSSPAVSGVRARAAVAV